MSATHNTYCFSKLLCFLNKLETEFKCKKCEESYSKKWYKPDNICFFCHNFIPMRDTYSTVLKELEWYFVQSGESNRKEFTVNFLDNFKLWANHFNIKPNRFDQRFEYDLRYDDYD